MRRLTIYVTDELEEEIRKEQNKKGGINLSSMFREAFRNRNEPQSNFHLLKEINNLKRKIKRIRNIANEASVSNGGGQ
jgi:predicted metal-dependent peptidase